MTRKRDPPAEPQVEETHQGWWYHERRAVLETPDGSRPNLQPWAARLRSWMLRQADSLPFPTAEPEVPAKANPYSFSLEWLTASLAQVINDLATFASSLPESYPDPLNADIRRVRLVSELELCTARVFEALIKQILYCSTFPPLGYRRAAIGGLLRHRCSACLKEKGVEHTIDFLGSIAHSFGLCGEHEECLKKDIQKLNLLRNQRAAHAGIQPGKLSETVKEALKRADEIHQERGSTILHALKHFQRIEDSFGATLFTLLKENKGAVPPVPSHGASPG